MPEQSLDVANVHAFLEEVCRTGVTKHVRRQAAGKCGGSGELMKNAPNELGCCGPAEGVYKKRAAAHSARASLRAILLHEIVHVAIGEEYASLTIALSGNRDCTRYEIDVVVDERDKLRDANSGCEEDLGCESSSRHRKGRACIRAKHRRELAARKNPRKTLGDPNSYFCAQKGTLFQEPFID
jgi:hypothetical protein